MAWAHCAISSFFFLPSSTIHCRRTTQTLAALSLPSPSKRRKNYLRPKLLKTLRKSYISYPILPQQTTEKREEEEVENFSETLEVDQRNVGDVLGGVGLVGGSINEQKEVVLEQNVGISDAPEALFGRLVFEVICYSALQTICVYCVIGVVGLIKKSRDGNGKTELRVLGSGIENGREKRVLGSGSGKENGILGSKMENEKENEGFVNVDEAQGEEKIGEIRLMARKARESEGLTKNTNGVGSSSDVVGVDGNGAVAKIAVSKDKANIEKEVDGQLKTLERKFGFIWNKSMGSLRRDLRNSSKVKDHPKGFQGRKDNGLSKGRSTVAQDASLKVNGDVIDVLDLSVPEKQEGMHSSNGKSQELKSTQDEDSVQVISGDTLKESVLKTLGNEEASQEMNGRPRSDCFQETSNDVVDSKKSSESKAKISRSFKNEVRRKPKFSKLGDKRANIQPDSWWMKLPYVLAIFLRRGPDPEARKGLYSLKMDEGLSSYTVAFEDRSDAKNFCYIMESCFAELGGFSAEVVPMTIKEIESLKSSTKKILVLRKGQLHLYAGQPLVDVEMALRAIVG